MPTTLYWPGEQVEEMCAVVQNPDVAPHEVMKAGATFLTNDRLSMTITPRRVGWARVWIEARKNPAWDLWLLETPAPYDFFFQATMAEIYLQIHLSEILSLGKRARGWPQVREKMEYQEQIVKDSIVLNPLVQKEMLYVAMLRYVTNHPVSSFHGGCWLVGRRPEEVQRANEVLDFIKKEE